MILQEPLYHTYHDYIKIELKKSDAYEFQKYATHGQLPTYSNIFNFYSTREDEI